MLIVASLMAKCISVSKPSKLEFKFIVPEP